MKSPKSNGGQKRGTSLKKLGEEYNFSLCSLAQLLTGIQLLDVKTSISIC